MPNSTGLPPDHVAPSSAQSAAGKIASLVGTWEKIPGKGSEKDDRGAALVRQTLIIRPDLTWVESSTWKDGPDTFSCAREWKWEEKPIAGDTVLLDGRKYLVQGDELAIFWGASAPANADFTKPVLVYKRIAKQP